MQTTSESAFESIAILVRNFRENEAYYCSSEFQELDARNLFINKMLIALGWDVLHEAQKNPYEREVKVENPVRVESHQKRADYAFFISPNFREIKFLLEAKAPTRGHLFNKENYRQICSYGWSATNPIAVLCDFYELHIIDTRFKPDIDTILSNKIMSFHYNEYLDKEKFRQIYYLISREAVAAGSIEKFSESLPKPKGKSFQLRLFSAGFQSIDDSFLEDLDEMRITLAKVFKRTNPQLNSKDLTETTQRTIDRLVFIRFLEDRLIEQAHFISEFGATGTVWGDFIKACVGLDAKYNGVVFKKHLIDARDFNEPDGNEFANICNNLSHKNSLYNFSYIPIHILGSIYERFLGKNVVASKKGVSLDEKPEIKKSGGVYYTPQYIVNYIVDNTIGEILKNRRPNEIAKLRVSDVACGSGSFLISVFDTVLQYLKKWYQEHPIEAKKDGCSYQHESGLWVLSLKQKKKVLLNLIYGVDLDPQAVEVTQLSLYLKLLEDETSVTAHELAMLFHERLLPDLSRNIVRGNSIIEPDILDSTFFSSLEEERLSPLDFSSEFPEIMDNGGFDVIVGNPPWVSLSGKFRNDIMTVEEIEYLTSKYKSNTYMPNLYEYFIYRVLELTKKGGIISLIVPDRMGYNRQFVSLRKKILDEFIIQKLVYKTPFPNITTDTLIFFLKKSSKLPIKDDYSFPVGEYKEALATRTRKNYIENPEYKFDFVTDNELNELVQKIYKSNDNKPLSFYVDSTSGFGGRSDKITAEQTGVRQIKILRGRNIHNFFTKGYYFFEFRKSNITGRTVDIKKLTSKDRVLLRKTGYPIICTYDNSRKFIEQSLYFLFNNKSELSMKYFTSIISSNLFQVIYLNHMVTNRDSTPQLKKSDLDLFPLPNLDLNNETDKNYHDKLVKIVEQLLISRKKAANSKSDTDKNYYKRKYFGLIRILNRIVYQIYALTPLEIELVERHFRDSKQKRASSKIGN